MLEYIDKWSANNVNKIWNSWSRNSERDQCFYLYYLMHPRCQSRSVLLLCESTLSWTRSSAVPILQCYVSLPTTSTRKNLRPYPSQFLSSREHAFTAYRQDASSFQILSSTAWLFAKYAPVAHRVFSCHFPFWHRTTSTRLRRLNSVATDIFISAVLEAVKLLRRAPIGCARLGLCQAIFNF